MLWYSFPKAALLTAEVTSVRRKFIKNEPANTSAGSNTTTLPVSLCCRQIISPDLTGSKKAFQTYGRKSSDFNLAVDEATGKAYLYVEYDHKDIFVCELTDDYMDVTES